MKTQFLTILVAIVFLTKMSIGQIQPVPSLNTTSFNTVERISRQLENENMLNNGKSIVGTPYLNKDYTSAVFYLKDQLTVESLTRLNLYEQHFEFKKDDNVFFVDPDLIDSVRFNSKLYVYKMLTDIGDLKKHVLEKVDDHKLYKLSTVVFKPEVQPGVYVDPKPARFEWGDPVYVLDVKHDYIILSNFNKLYKSFPEKKNELKKFIKKHDIKKDDEKGLILLIGYVENL